MSLCGWSEVVYRHSAMIKLLQLHSDEYFNITVVNNSDKAVRWNVFNYNYRNQLQLFKEDNLIPYRKEMAELLRAKDEKPDRVETGPDLFMEPNTTCCSMGTRLSDWFGPLAPGKYRLTVRHRFEINGPWTAESAPMVFEILPFKKI